MYLSYLPLINNNCFVFSFVLKLESFICQQLDLMKNISFCDYNVIILSSSREILTDRRTEISNYIVATLVIKSRRTQKSKYNIVPNRAHLNCPKYLK